LAIRTSATPLPLRCFITSSLISPAPRTSARRPRSAPKTPSASFTATYGTERELSPIPVSERIFLPTLSEEWNRRFKTGPVRCSSVAAR
jgi:hypothetical protein